jgi:hypothetical protein
MPPVRRLAAILAADVAGYSRLMGADEEGTHERLRAHLRELIEPKIAEHRGLALGPVPSPHNGASKGGCPDHLGLTQPPRLRLRPS